MVNKISIEKYDETYIKILAEPSILYDLQSEFTFDVPGAKFMPAYKNRTWDGKIRLLNVMSGLIYKGLLPYVEEIFKDNGYDYSIYGKEENRVTDPIFQSIMNFIKLPETITPRPYQLDAFKHGLEKNRALFLLPTSSGKSLIIYFLAKSYKGKILIIVPTTGLVHQMYNDFISYGFEEKEMIKIFAGQNKYPENKIVITTWQSIYQLHKRWFEQFEVVIGDEAHLFKATSLTKIMTKLNKCKYRFGFTGTIDGTLTNKMVLEGLFGKIYSPTTTKELMDSGYVSELKINSIVLKYPPEICQLNKKNTYHQEIDLLINHEPRNKFIAQLATTISGNTLILYNLVDKHGKVLYDLIKASTNRMVYYIHGGLSGEEREQIRQEMDTQQDAILVASYGTMSTGVNIPSINNIIFASPMKSRVRNLQSIGRGLRISNNKKYAVLYDIADDLTWKNHTNYTLKHFMERIEIYNEQKFNYKIHNHLLK